MYFYCSYFSGRKNQMKIIIKSVFIICVLLRATTLLAIETIYFDRPKLATDKRGEDVEYILKRVLEVTNDKYGEAKFEYTDKVMSRTRSLYEMQKGEEIHVMAAHPKPDWDENAICIQFPLRRGLLSYRLFLIKERHQQLLSKVETLEQLKRIPTGSRTQWSISKALEENGFNLMQGIKYDLLFTMLDRERFLTFSRGISEIFGELKAYKQKFPDLVIEKDLLLYVYIPTYFYVSPKKLILAKRIEEGLSILEKSGEFENIFQKFHADKIKKGNLENRRFFYINNPSISEERYEADKKYLYFPKTKKN
mgnify:CR=1 FL=1